MARSSRHKSHRSHKHRDRSDSEEEGNSREGKTRVEEEDAKVSRVSEPEKRKSSSKDLVGSSNGDFSGESGKKRKERGEDSTGPDRWNGGGDDDPKVDKELKKEGFETLDLDKGSKSKHSVADVKGRSSERSEEKRKLEKESSRRESNSQYKDGKERERERGQEKDKKIQDPRHERSDNVSNRKEERSVKKDIDNSEWQLQEELRNPELEKELEKRIKKRKDESGDNDKRVADGKDSEDRRMSSRDDRSKAGSYKDERHKEGRYREKYKEDLDRDQRHHDDKHRGDHSSRVLTTDRSDNKHSRDESRISESRYKKAKLQDSDHDGSPHVDDHSTKPKDNRGRKRSSDDIEDHGDAKLRSAKEPREDREKNGSSSSRFDSRTDRARLEHSQLNKVDSKRSPSSSTGVFKDQSRHSSRQTESARRESLSEETRRATTASRGDHGSASGSRERVSESRSLEKTKSKEGIRLDGSIKESDAAAGSHYDGRTPRSDARISSNHLIEISPSSTSDRRSERTGARRNLDMEEVRQRSSSSKDGKDSFYTKVTSKERELPEKLNVDDSSQSELISLGSSFNRTVPLQSSSPGHLPPPPPVRIGVDSPSVLGSYEDDNRNQNGDRRGSSRYRRSADVSMVRGQGTPWKNAPTWPSPAANGFIPLPHGPGFHPAVQQFPGSPLFGVRPSMDLNHTGVSYNVHDAINRFSGHARPYGWHNPVDECPPHMQVWDGSNNVFSDDSHMYGRQEWDQNRHLMGSRGWGMSADMWKGQNGNMSMEFPVPQAQQEYSSQALAGEAWAGQSGHHSRVEEARSEQPTADVCEIKEVNDTVPAKNAVDMLSKSLHEKTVEPSKLRNLRGTSDRPTDHNVGFCCNYLSKLDISLDLVQPELYKECISLMGTKDEFVTDNVSKQTQTKTNIENRMVRKSKQYVLNAIFPTAADATYQRAMSLYKKQNGGMKEGIRRAVPSVSSRGEKDQPEVSNGEKGDADSANYMEEDSSEPNTNSANDTKDRPSITNAVAADLMKEENNTNTDAEGSLTGYSGEQECDDNSNAVVFVEGSEESEALMPECRVNLSRIHLSPESTH